MSSQRPEVSGSLSEREMSVDERHFFLVDLFVDFGLEMLSTVRTIFSFGEDETAQKYLVLSVACLL